MFETCLIWASGATAAGWLGCSHGKDDVFFLQRGVVHLYKRHSSVIKRWWIWCNSWLNHQMEAAKIEACKLLRKCAEEELRWGGKGHFDRSYHRNKTLFTLWQRLKSKTTLTVGYEETATWCTGVWVAICQNDATAVKTSGQKKSVMKKLSYKKYLNIAIIP